MPAYIIYIYERAATDHDHKVKILDPSIGLDEIVTLHYGLSYTGGIITLQKRAKKLKYMYSKVGHFWCWLAQAEPNATSSEKLRQISVANVCWCPLARNQITLIRWLGLLLTVASCLCTRFYIHRLIIEK